MLRKLIVTAAAVGLSGFASSAHAEKKKQHVHDHGHGKLSVAVDGNTVAFDLDLPADGLYGFEYEPRTAAEKKTFAEANAKLQEHPESIFIFPAELGCKVTTAHVKKEDEDEGEKAPATTPAKSKGKTKRAETHADINGDFRFQCDKSPAGAKIKIAMLKAFPRVKDLKMQINSATNQSAVSITKPEQEISL